MSEEEARDWDEYLAWTRGAQKGQYELTEERAWSRLQTALMRRRIAPYEIPPPRDDDLLGIEGESSNPSRPEGESDSKRKYPWL